MPYCNQRAPLPYSVVYNRIVPYLSDPASLTAIYELSAFQGFALRLPRDGFALSTLPVSPLPFRGCRTLPSVLALCDPGPGAGHISG